MDMGEDNCGKPCGPECKHEKEHDMPVVMMHLAHAAWNELMVEKMKAAFNEKRGPYMDKAAQVAVDHSIAFWNAKMQGKELSEEEHKDYAKKLMDVFQG
jgi:hypothetical protein